MLQSSRSRQFWMTAKSRSEKCYWPELQAFLAESRISCVLAGNQRLVLRYAEEPPHAPSGHTNPELHVLNPSNVVTTDGTSYGSKTGVTFSLASGRQ
jgi:hypothetical protein